MNQELHSAPGVALEDRVILFDGVCRLCSVWARFLIKFDRKHHFKLATVQSPEGRAILEWYGYPIDYYETMLLVEGSHIYTKSSAFFRVMRQLPGRGHWYVSAGLYLHLSGIGYTIVWH